MFTTSAGVHDMVSRYLKMAAVGLFLASGVVQAHDWGEGWERRHAYLHPLREACEDGDRHACVRLGIEIGERRERREAWREERRRNPPAYYGGWYHDTRGEWHPDRFR
jgi:hypothetical protein